MHYLLENYFEDIKNINKKDVIFKYKRDINCNWKK